MSIVYSKLFHRFFLCYYKCKNKRPLINGLLYKLLLVSAENFVKSEEFEDSVEESVEYI